MQDKGAIVVAIVAILAITFLTNQTYYGNAINGLPDDIFERPTIRDDIQQLRADIKKLTESYCPTEINVEELVYTFFESYGTLPAAKYFCQLPEVQTICTCPFFPDGLDTTPVTTTDWLVEY